MTSNGAADLPGYTDATFESFDGRALAYRSTPGQGTGKPIVVLHGFIVDRRSTPRLFLEALGNLSTEVITPDHRGHGKSAAFVDELPPDALARDVSRLFDHLGVTESDEVDLVGYSMGALIALRVALHDQRIRRLVLGGIGDRAIDPSWDRPRELADALLGGPSGADGGRYAEFARQVGGDPIALARVQQSIVLSSPNEVASLTAPTLVIAGIDDDENGDPNKLADAIPGALLERPPGDHLTALSTSAFADLVVGFLQP